MTIRNKSPTSEIAKWLNHLYEITPADGIILIGAGREECSWIQWLKKLESKHVTLIEADKGQFKHLSESLSLPIDWKISNSLISNNSQTVPYYYASYRAESGLLKLENLISIWPNIKTTHEKERQTITLEKLKKDEKINANWLLIDCLPALHILQGASNTLHKFDLIVTRTILTKQNNGVDQQANQKIIEDYLNEQGYRCLIVEPERNPAIGHSLYVRKEQAIDLRSKLKNTIADKVSIEKEMSDKKVHLEILNKEKITLQQQNKKLSDANLELEKQLEGLNKEETTLQQQVKKLRDTNLELEKKLASSIQNLKESEYRQKMMDEELIKAKAQIELIKDLLLNGSEI